MAEYRVLNPMELIKCGKDLGLVGAELQAYVKDTEAKQENEKQEAKAEKEKQEVKAKQEAEAKELKAEKAKQEAEAKAEKAKQEAEAKVQAAKLEAQAARLEAERKEKDARERDDKAIAREANRRKEEMDEKARDRDLQLARDRLAAEEKDKERQFQMERDRADREAKAELARTEGANAADKMRFEIGEKEDRQLEENKIRLEREKLDAGTTRGGDDTERRTGDRTRGPKIAVWNDKEDMDGYLKKFENIARHNRWDRGSWATFLSGVLTGKATDVLTRMPVEDVNDYDLVKAELLKRFNKTEEGFKQKFFSSKAETDESPQQYLARLVHYLTRWVELAEVDQSYEGLRDLVVREQFLGMCSKEMEIFLREGAVKELAVLAKRAEHYLEAHKTKGLGWTRTMMRVETRREEPRDNRGSKPEVGGNKFTEMRRCLNCGMRGHIIRDCRKLRRDGTGAMEMDDYEEYGMEEMGAVEMQDWKSRRGNTTPNRGQFSRGNGYEYRPRPGYNRGQENMYGRGMNYRSWSKPPQPSPVAAEVKPIGQKVLCKQHHKESCADCLDLPAAVAHTCNALLAEFVELKCGCTIPVVADACKVARKGNMPVTTGKVNGKSVSVLRDTGCSTIVVKRDLVEDSQLTGKETSCVLIDWTIRRTQH